MVSRSAFTLLIAVLFVGCGEADTTEENGNALSEALTFHVSFDDGPDAGVAGGDPAAYHAPSWSDRSDSAPGLPADTLVRIVEDGGVRGAALEFLQADPSIVLYQAAGNIAYTPENWSGTMSFWLRLDPDEDLAPGYTDPIQISPNQWNDAALFVDFTAEDDPRHFRFAAFADYGVWNPDSLGWGDVAYEDRPMVEVADPLPFSGDEWTHVVMAYENLNTGQADASVRTYLNGEYQGTLSGRELTLTWDLEATIIGLGLSYVGMIDEISLFERALSEEEITELYQLQGQLPAE